MELQFIPSDKPYSDEAEAISQAITDIKNGDVENLSSVDWSA